MPLHELHLRDEKRRIENQIKRMLFFKESITNHLANPFSENMSVQVHGRMASTACAPQTHYLCSGAERVGGPHGCLVVHHGGLCCRHHGAHVGRLKGRTEQAR